MGLFSKLKRKQRHQPLQSRVLNGKASGRILFVSHEATLTGAPKIILNVLKHFHEKTNANLQTILHNDGHLADEFGRYSEVDCLNIPRESSDQLTKRIRKLCHRYHHDPPVLAICNSMESRYVAFELQQLDIPVLFLVHELPSSYCSEDYARVYECSQRVIFPIQAVYDAAQSKVPIPGQKGVVMSQGLLQAEFGRGMDPVEARAQIRMELGLPSDALVVLGCGTLDLRKGIDHFCAVARETLKQKKLAGKVHFVWIGDGPRWIHSAHHYVMLDVEKSPANGHVHFIGERENVEPYFLGADTFLLTSRVDPFPCVIHEAMAAQLPVITFDESGGAPEAVSGGAGIVVPYGDYKSMADMIHLLATQPAIADNIRRRSTEKVSTIYRFDYYANRMIRLAEETAERKFATGTLETTGTVGREATFRSDNPWLKAA